MRSHLDQPAWKQRKKGETRRQIEVRLQMEVRVNSSRASDAAEVTGWALAGSTEADVGQAAWKQRKKTLTTWT